MTFVKATLQNVSSNPPGPRIEVLFNPESYIQTRTTNYADLPIPGLQRPLIQFVNGGNETLEVV